MQRDRRFDAAIASTWHSRRPCKLFDTGIGLAATCTNPVHRSYLFCNLHTMTLKDSELVRSGRLLQPSLSPPHGRGHAPRSGAAWAAPSEQPQPGFNHRHAPAGGSPHGNAAVPALEELGRAAWAGQVGPASGPADVRLRTPRAVEQQKAHLLAHANSQPPAEADAVRQAQA